MSLHVYAVPPGDGGEPVEHLRFDCFDEDPHYHYVSVRDGSNVVAHLDPVAIGDPLAWALDRLRHRLPQMLAHAGASDLAERVDAAAIDDVLPRVTEAAFRLRYAHADGEARP